MWNLKKKNDIIITILWELYEIYSILFHAKENMCGAWDLEMQKALLAHFQSAVAGYYLL